MTFDADVGDVPAIVALGPPLVRASGFVGYETYQITLTQAGFTFPRMTRDLVRIGEVVGVLCVDRARGCLVLIRQFRLSAHLVTGRGDMIELPAGRVEAGEEPEAAARRECLEETCLSPLRMQLMFEVMPAPGVLDENATLYFAEVDSRDLPARAGLDTETEVTHPFAVPIDAALRLLEGDRCMNGYLITALQWLALNRARLGL
ncbi:MAG: NUDIX hydrolase [Pseudomonadota bacterium]